MSEPQEVKSLQLGALQIMPPEHSEIFIVTMKCLLLALEQNKHEMATALFAMARKIESPPVIFKA